MIGEGGGPTKALQALRLQMAFGEEEVDAGKGGLFCSALGAVLETDWVGVRRAHLSIIECLGYFLLCVHISSIRCSQADRHKQKTGQKWRTAVVTWSEQVNCT